MYVSGYYSTYRSLQVIWELSKYQSLLLRRIHIANTRLDGSDAAENEDCELTELFSETFHLEDAISVHYPALPRLQGYRKETMRLSTTGAVGHQQQRFLFFQSETR